MCHFVEAGRIFGRLIDAIRKETLDTYIHILTQNENEYLHLEPYIHLRIPDIGNVAEYSLYLSTFLSDIYK